MPKFLVIQKDPQEYKEEILQFWREYLPDTPPERFEWMQCGNPAGPAIWFFACEENSTKLAGTLSIMPRELSCSGQTLRAGILGDYMVSGEYRVFGPALQILKTALAHLSPLQFNFFYTIPNPDSTKMIQRAGLSAGMLLRHLAKPINLGHYLSKRMSPWLARMIAPCAAPGLNLLSREAWCRVNDDVAETPVIDESFDQLWYRIKSTHFAIVGDLSAAYLNWRYFKNPLYAFRLLTVRNQSQGELLGYAFFTISDGKLDIFDLVFLEKRHALILLKKLSRIAKDEDCTAIYCRSLEANPCYPTLKACNYFDARDDAHVFFYGRELDGTAWHFFSGERNI